MLLARRSSVPTVVIESAARLLESHPEMSNVEILQRLALELGAEVTALIPVTRVERLVREPALNRIRMGHRGTLNRAATNPLVSRSDATRPDAARPETPGSEAIVSDPEEAVTATMPADDSRTGSAYGPGSVPVNRLTPGVIQAVDDALLEAFTLGADSGSDAEVVEHFRDLDRIRARVREALEAR
ncbi:MAG: hypothetical protein EA422_04335 [Gemmatimonadales bacterium]|nr:MAG: hypothetical protein EA422_04335 [Gemmatimonadales bacterium]